MAPGLQAGVHDRCQGFGYLAVALGVGVVGGLQGASPRVGQVHPDDRNPHLPTQDFVSRGPFELLRSPQVAQQDHVDVVGPAGLEDAAGDSLQGGVVGRVQVLLSRVQIPSESPALDSSGQPEVQVAAMEPRPDSRRQRPFGEQEGAVLGLVVDVVQDDQVWFQREAGVQQRQPGLVEAVAHDAGIEDFVAGL